MIHAKSAATAVPAVDEGLRQHMLSVYNLMCGGLALSGLVAAMVAWTGIGALFYTTVDGEATFTALGWVGMLAPLAMLLVAMLGGRSWSASTTRAFYWAFTAAQGVGLSTVLMAHTGADLAMGFFAAAATFAGLSLYGYTTRRDLTGVGTFCMMALIGLIVVSLVALLFGVGFSTTVFSLLAVLLFAGLTAYDTQNIKECYNQAMGQDDLGRAAVWGALSLYLDALNLFVHLTRLLGGSRD